MDLLKSMLEKNPANRPLASQAILHEAFEQVLSKSPLRPTGIIHKQQLLEYNRLTEKLNY